MIFKDSSPKHDFENVRLAVAIVHATNDLLVPGSHLSPVASGRAADIWSVY